MGGGRGGALRRGIFRRGRMPCRRRGSGVAPPGERRPPVGEQRPRARVPAAAASGEGAHGGSPSEGARGGPPQGRTPRPWRGSASTAAPPQHDCLNMLRMEASLASFVRLLGRGRARAKAEPRPMLQIRSHCAGKEKLYGKVAD